MHNDENNQHTAHELNAPRVEGTVNRRRFLGTASGTAILGAMASRPVLGVTNHNCLPSGFCSLQTATSHAPTGLCGGKTTLEISVLVDAIVDAVGSAATAALQTDINAQLAALASSEPSNLVSNIFGAVSNLTQQLLALAGETLSILGVDVTLAEGVNNIIIPAGSNGSVADLLVDLSVDSNAGTATVTNVSGLIGDQVLLSGQVLADILTSAGITLTNDQLQCLSASLTTIADAGLTGLDTQAGVPSGATLADLYADGNINADLLEFATAYINIQAINDFDLDQATLQNLLDGYIAGGVELDTGCILGKQEIINFLINTHTFVGLTGSGVPLQVGP